VLLTASVPRRLPQRENAKGNLRAYYSSRSKRATRRRVRKTSGYELKGYGVWRAGRMLAGAAFLDRRNQPGIWADGRDTITRSFIFSFRWDLSFAFQPVRRGWRPAVFLYFPIPAVFATAEPWQFFSQIPSLETVFLSAPAPVSVLHRLIRPTKRSPRLFWSSVGVQAI